MEIAVTQDGKKVYVANAENDNVSVIDTVTNTVTATVNAGIYPTGVVIVPLKDSNMTAQSTWAKSNATEDIEVEDTNLSSSEEINAVELNNSKINNSESDNDSISGENEPSKNNSTPGFGLLGSLTCLYAGWKFKKK
jgi:YVTN family beta-propeller protein